jgi:hypothetical protein
VRFGVIVVFGMAARWLVTIRWREGDARFEEQQTVTAF